MRTPDQDHAKCASCREWRTSETARRHVFRLVPAFLAWVGALATSDARAQDEWTGKRVVQKAADLTLRINDEPVESSRSVLRIYRVEQADGASLLVNSIEGGQRGWANRGDVIDFDRALLFFNQQIQVHPGDAFAFAMVGLIRADRREYDLAIRNFSEAIRLDPKSAASFAGRGSAWRGKREFDKAIADFDQAIGLDGKSAHAFLGRGLTRAARSEYAQAIADFSEAIWLDPLSIAAYENRGRAWQAKGEHAKAVIDYDRALRFQPERGDLHRERGRSWEAQKSYRRALADYDEAIRIDPNDAMAYRDRGWLLATCPDRGMRDGKLAVLDATKACELSEWQNADLLDSLAAVCAASGDFESAVKWQAKSNALSRSPVERGEGEARLKRYALKKL